MFLFLPPLAPLALSTLLSIHTAPPVHMEFVKTATSIESFQSFQNFQSVEYIDAYDGDTFTVNLPNLIPDVFGKKMPVRIRHIDTAEMNGKTPCEKEMAQKAKDVVASLLKNAKKIDLVDVDRDKYFRLLCSVNITTQANETFDLSNYLMAEGYAVPYEGETKPKTDWCSLLRKRKLSPH
jgi:endonuclease YncB( thermonuclease family)